MFEWLKNGFVNKYKVCWSGQHYKGIAIHDSGEYAFGIGLSKREAKYLVKTLRNQMYRGRVWYEKI